MIYVEGMSQKLHLGLVLNPSLRHPLYLLRGAGFFEIPETPGTVRSSNRGYQSDRICMAKRCVTHAGIHWALLGFLEDRRPERRVLHPSCSEQSFEQKIHEPQYVVHVRHWGINACLRRIEKLTGRHTDRRLHGVAVKNACTQTPGAGGGGADRLPPQPPLQ